MRRSTTPMPSTLEDPQSTRRRSSLCLGSPASWTQGSNARLLPLAPRVTRPQTPLASQVATTPATASTSPL